MKTIVIALALAVTAGPTFALTIPTTNLPVLTWPSEAPDTVTRNCTALDQTTTCS